MLPSRSLWMELIFGKFWNMVMDLLFNYMLLILLSLCAVSDVRANKIPNYLTMPFAACAIVLSCLSNGMDGFLFSTAGMATGIALLVIPYVIGGMGAGDVKLMGAVGSFLGAKATLGAFLFIALAGGIYSLAIILIRRDIFKGFFSERLLFLSSMVMLRPYVPIETKNTGQKPRLKYGVAIAFGTITYLVTKALGITFFT
jgi:prepilin peptidase CpaA